MAHRMETVRNLEEELFVLMTLGDDRAVRETASYCRRTGVCRKQDACR